MITAYTLDDSDDEEVATLAIASLKAGDSGTTNYNVKDMVEYADQKIGMIIEKFTEPLPWDGDLSHIKDRYKDGDMVTASSSMPFYAVDHEDGSTGIYTANMLDKLPTENIGPEEDKDYSATGAFTPS